jgi:hypothetical protein
VDGALAEGAWPLSSVRLLLSIGSFSFYFLKTFNLLKTIGREKRENEKAYATSSR